MKKTQIAFTIISTVFLIVILAWILSKMDKNLSVKQNIYPSNAIEKQIQLYIQDENKAMHSEPILLNRLQQFLPSLVSKQLKGNSYFLGYTINDEGLKGPIKVYKRFSNLNFSDDIETITVDFTTLYLKKSLSYNLKGKLIDDNEYDFYTKYYYDSNENVTLIDHNGEKYTRYYNFGDTVWGLQYTSGAFNNYEQIELYEKNIKKDRSEVTSKLFTNDDYTKGYSVYNNDGLIFYKYKWNPEYRRDEEIKRVAKINDKIKVISITQDNIDISKETELYEYDAEGRIKKYFVATNFNILYEYVYNKDGYTEKRFSFSNKQNLHPFKVKEKELFYTRQIKLDNKGDIITDLYSDWHNHYIDTHENKYDKYGNCIYEKVFRQKLNDSNEPIGPKIIETFDVFEISYYKHGEKDNQAFPKLDTGIEKRNLAQIEKAKTLLKKQ